MFAVLYALAVAMIAGGFYAAFTGWELLLLERGWSMVISGVTFATGGFVVAGVAAAAQALARRLDAVAEAVRASRPAAQPTFPRRPGTPESEGTSSAAPAHAAPAPAPVPREIAPKLPPQEPASPAGPAPMAALGLGGVAAEAVAPAMEPRVEEPQERLAPLELGPVAAHEREDVRSASDEPADAGEPADADQPVGVEMAEVATADEKQPVAEPRVDDARDSASVGDEEALDETSPEPQAEEDDAVEPVEPVEPPAFAAAGIEAPVLRPREPGAAPADVEALDRRYEPEIAPEAASAPDAEPSDAEGDQAERASAEALPAGTPLPDEAALGQSPDEADVAPVEPPHVVGTHVSGANRYVMYSDGSIEAETPDGRLLFGSIEELKGYVASAGEDPSGTTQTGPR